MSEVSALCGLVLRRLQDLGVGQPDRDQTPVTIQNLSEIFGEALQQFSDEDVEKEEKKRKKKEKKKEKSAMREKKDA
jgi:hypothetical protein